MQRLLYKDKALIGLDISTSDIKVMAINNKKDVIGYGAIDISNEKFHKSLEENDDYLLLQLKKLFSEKIHGHLPSPQPHKRTRVLFPYPQVRRKIFVKQLS